MLALFLLVSPWWGRGALTFVRELEEYRASRTVRERWPTRQPPARKWRRFSYRLLQGPSTPHEREREERVTRLLSLALQLAGLMVATAALLLATL